VEYRTVFPVLARKRKAGYFFKMKRVCVYIDGANFFGGLRIINPKYSDTKFDFEKYIKQITGKNKLICVYYYNAPLIQKYNKEIYWKQIKFFERLKKFDNFKVILCKRQHRQNQDGKHYYTIKGDDIHLAIDMLRDAYEDKYDTAVLISGDGDFAPLVRYVKIKGKKVENYHFKGNISYDLTKECDTNCIINKKIVNKFFYRKSGATK
jgi:uncharacterized LabA/DUF88 family protein